MTQRKIILAIHGAGLQASVWGAVVPHLLEYAFKALNLPGHDPHKPDETPLTSIADMAAWVCGKMDDMPADSHVVLLGHSMGALVALEAAAHPAVSAVVILGAAAAMPVNPDLLKTAHEQPADAAKLVVKWSVYKGHAQFDAVTTIASSVMAATPPMAIGADLAACDAYQQGADTAGALQKPVLVISGDADRMATPTAGQALAALLPQGEYALLADCGHMMMIEKPIETAHEIKAFLGT